MRSARHHLVATALVALAAAPAGAQVLRFDEVLATSSGAGDVPLPLSFYDGAGGPAYDFGIQFETFYDIPPYAACLGPVQQGCPGSRGTDPVAAAQGTNRAAMRLYEEPGITLITHTEGFTNGFSFLYARSEVWLSTGSAWVTSGPHGTGSVLASITLTPTPFDPNDPGCAGAYGNCPFVPVSLSFAGTAHSVVLTAAPHGSVLYDDLTFGSTTPGVLAVAAVPEPTTTALVTTGLLAVGALVRRRRTG